MVISTNEKTGGKITDGKTEALGENPVPLSTTPSTTNPTRNSTESNLGARGDKP